MTQMRSDSVNKHISRAFFGKLFRDRWTQFVLYFFVFFFSASVPLMMYVTQLKERAMLDGMRTDPIDQLTSFINDVPMFYIIISGIVAIFCAIMMFSYLNSRVSVNFYHSLPLRRTKLFLMHYAVGLLLFASAVSVNLLICIGIIAANGYLTAAIALMLVKIALSALVYFVVIYSMTVLVGMLTGLAPVQFLLTLFVSVILPALYLAWVLINAEFTNNFWYDYYFNYDKLKWLSPIFFAGKGEVLSLHEILGALAFSLVCIITAIILYHFRLSERSGNPIVFNGFASFIKYAVMLPATVYAAVLFYEIGGWFYFGAVSGSLLAWMISNAIINKTGRAMFKGVRGMVIFTVCILAVLSFPRFDLFGVSSKIPDRGVVTEIEASFGNDDRIFEFKESANIGALYQLYEYSNDRFNSVIEVYDYASTARSWRDVTIGDETYSLSVPNGGGWLKLVFKNKFGLSCARSIYISSNYELDRQLELIVDSEEFKRQYIEYANDSSKQEIRISFPYNKINGEIAMTTLGDGKISGFNDYYQDEATSSDTTLRKAIVSDASKVSYEYFNSPCFGGVNISEDGRTVNGYIFSIFSKSSETLAYLEKCGIINSTDYASDFAKCVKRIVVYDFELDRTLVLDDKADIEEILGSLSERYNRYSWFDNGLDSFFAVPEKRYSALVTYVGCEEYESYEYDELTNTEYTKMLTSDEVEHTDAYMFFKWQVPEQIVAAFDSAEQ